MKAQEIWAAGDYPAVARFIAGVGEDVVRRAEVGPGDDVLDVACGNGNAALPAARAGARVTGVDITPELLAAGRAAAPDITWVEGDAQALPFADGSFDVVLSTFGCMFAPDHRRAAGEIVRVLRPGGRAVIASWTPGGTIGAFFATIAKHLPPEPGGDPPILWGEEEHLRGLFAGLDLRFAGGVVRIPFDSAEDAFDFYIHNFGPLVIARAAAADPAALDADLRALYADHGHEDADGWSYDAEYLILQATAGTAAPT